MGFFTLLRVAGVLVLAGAAHATLPAFFVAGGQTGAGETDYLVHTARGIRRVSPLEILHDGVPDDFRMRLSGSRDHIAAEPAQPLPAVIHFLTGNDPTFWRRGLTAYRSLRYREIYAGIDLIYSAGIPGPSTTFSLARGADPKLIQVEVTGALNVAVDPGGALIVETPVGILRGTDPHAYQDILGQRREVDISLCVSSRFTVSIQLGAYDPAQTVSVDPGLLFSSYLGGSGFDSATALAVDAAGNVYVAGWTDSSDLRTLNSVGGTRGSGVDAFVAKIAANGSLIYCTYLGGSGDDRAFAVAVDSSGSSYVAGSTTSPNFPVANALQARLAGSKDGFVSKLSPAGNSLVFSTYLGGSGSDSINAIAVDRLEDVYIAGETASADLPRPAGYRAFAGQTDAFVAELVPLGNSLAYLTYLGGSADDRALGVAIDFAGNVFVTGSTLSLDFPTTAGAAQTASGGNQDAFITKLNSSGSSLIYSTYLGGSGGTLGYPEVGSGIAVDAFGSAYVTGTTGSPNFPLSHEMQSSRSGSATDAFVTKLNSSGSALVYSTYLGGSGPDAATAIAVDSLGQAYVVGYTSSIDFPVVRPIQSVLAGSYDVFLSQFSADGRTLIQSTYLGGSESDAAAAIAVTANAVYIAGQSASLNLPVNAPLQPAMAGGYDAFLALLKPACGITATPSGLALKSYATSVSISIATAAGCSWSAASLNGWIGIGSPAGSGSGILSINIAANAGVARSGVITVGGQVITVAQSNGTVSSNFDINHDGRIDLFWQNPDTGDSQVWLLGGSSGISYSGGVTLFQARNSRIAAIADLDGDGNPDLVWQHPVTGAVEVWFLGGTSGNSVLGTVALTSANPWRVVATGDFDGDGRTDLVWQDPLTGHAQIWYIGGSSSNLTLLGVANITDSNHWRIAGAADFDRDGRPDLIWQDAASGAAQVWFMGGLLGNVVVGATNVVLANSWRIAAMADFNNDGHSDIIWQDPETGKSQVWLLGGAQGTALLGTSVISGPNMWRIVAPK